MLQLWGCKELDTTEGLSDEGKSSHFAIVFQETIGCF